jgi:hypothetical protein
VKVAHPSPSSRALAEALKNTTIAAALEGRVHRTELWRYAKGYVTPAADRAALLESEGRKLEVEIPANGWTPDAAQGAESAEQDEPSESPATGPTGGRAA